MALDLAIKNQLQEYMTRLINPIKLVAYVDENPSSNEMIEMLEEVASLSEKITLSKVTDVSKRIPSFEVNREKELTGITFAGIPSGHEFTSFVLALLQASGYPLKIDAEKIEQIKKSINDEYGVGAIPDFLKNQKDKLLKNNLHLWEDCLIKQTQLLLKIRVYSNSFSKMD